MEIKLFGSLPTGENVHKYTLKNEYLEAVIMDRGACIVSLVFNGTDVVGGFDSLDDYLADTSHQGALIGRVANRIENARFVMDGVEYKLPKNDGENCLHGGVGFDYRVFSVTEYSDSKIVMEYDSFDGEEGFPAGLNVKVCYELIGKAIVISYEATPDGKTPISLTNHSYFNLDGFGGDVKEHSAVIYADTYTEIDGNLIPNGKHPSVVGTVFDFRKPRKIGEALSDSFIGYDHNFVISGTKKESFAGQKLTLAAEVWGKKAKMSVYTDQSGVQFYIGNFLGDGPDFKGGVKQIRHGAFCLETQSEPNSVNHGVGFYSKGEKYTHTTVYAFQEND